LANVKYTGAGASLGREPEVGPILFLKRKAWQKELRSLLAVGQIEMQDLACPQAPRVLWCKEFNHVVIGEELRHCRNASAPIFVRSLTRFFSSAARTDKPAQLSAETSFRKEIKSVRAAVGAQLVM
jgi:hypothetical protein